MAIGVIGLVWLGVFAPFKIGVAIWFATKLFVAGYAGYLIDRVVFPYARPHEMTEQSCFGARIITRAIIIAACLIAGGLQA